MGWLRFECAEQWLFLVGRRELVEQRRHLLMSIVLQTSLLRGTGHFE